jgi:hypothetical protein
MVRLRDERQGSGVRIIIRSFYYGRNINFPNGLFAADIVDFVVGKRCPAGDNETIEIRQVMQFEDFPQEVREAVVGFSEVQKKR